MTEIPSPAEVAAQLREAAERAQEVERVKRVRQRRRARRGARITTHVSDETAAALAKLARPDVPTERKN